MAACQLLDQGLEAPEAVPHSGQKSYSVFAGLKQKYILSPTKVLDVFDWLELDSRSHGTQKGLEAIAVLKGVQGQGRMIAPIFGDRRNHRSLRSKVLHQNIAPRKGD